MTTHELAKKLLKLPDVMVTVSRYEGGSTEIEFIDNPKELALDVNEEWYYGKHEYVDTYKELDNYKKTTAINIG